MSAESRAGRPRASSRATLAEAACELFLEQGYEATSVAEITQRAGVSRSSFFNYFSSKSDVLWSGMDECIDRLRDGLGAGSVRDAVHAALAGFVPDALALALTHVGVMDLDEELDRDAALRSSRIAKAVADRLVADGVTPLTARVRGASVGGAVLAAVRVWAEQGTGRRPLGDILDHALEELAWTHSEPQEV